MWKAEKDKKIRELKEQRERERGKIVNVFKRRKKEEEEAKKYFGSSKGRKERIFFECISELREKFIESF